MPPNITEYGPNKGPRVGENNITETIMPHKNKTQPKDGITTERTTIDTTELFSTDRSTIPTFRFNVVTDSTTMSDESTEFTQIPIEETTLAIGDNENTKRPTTRVDTSMETDDTTTNIILTKTSTQLPTTEPSEAVTDVTLTPFENTTDLITPIGKTVLKSCNTNIDCAPSQMCINQKCLNDKNDTNQTSVDSQGTYINL